ncbi:MAG: hypothetical protein JNL70_08540 [Saprospiraceae bacterium]|nr:hypothetical protein [Saprospiraceae bacterium]
MLKILLDHTKLKQDEVKPRVDFLVKKMKGVALYNAFDTQITALEALASDYDNALFVAKDGGSPQEKNKLKAEIIEFLSKLARKIEVAANDFEDEAEGLAYAKGSGFTVQESVEKKAYSFLEVPGNFTVIDFKPKKGACKLTWDRVLGAITYLPEELDKDGTWKSLGVCKKRQLVLEGTESEVKRTFRIRAGGAGTLVSDYSEAVSVWVR